MTNNRGVNDAWCWCITMSDTALELNIVSGSKFATIEWMENKGFFCCHSPTLFHQLLQRWKRWNGFPPSPGTRLTNRHRKHSRKHYQAGVGWGWSGEGGRNTQNVKCWRCYGSDPLMAGTGTGSTPDTITRRQGRAMESGVVGPKWGWWGGDGGRGVAKRAGKVLTANSHRAATPAKIFRELALFWCWGATKVGEIGHRGEKNRPRFV